MTMNFLRWLACCLMLGAAAGALAENYQVGQIWSYKTRPQEPNSTLMILRIDNTSKLGPVVFIGLKDLHVKHPTGKAFSSMSPLPFTKEALDQSVVKLIGKSDTLMSSNFGYSKWKEVQLSGKTPSTYTKPVAEVVERLENGYIGIPMK
jgi:hypothetical protein